MRASARRPAVRLLALLLGGALTVSAAAAVQRVEVAPGQVAVFGTGGELSLEAVPLPGEGLLAFSRRLCGDEEAAVRIAELNGGPRMLAGVRYRVPFALLAPEGKQAVLDALFPGDRRSASGWVHRVGLESLAGGAGLWSLAELFTGDGRAFAQLREANRIGDEHLRPGQDVWIPAALLRPSLRTLLPAGLGPGPGVALEYREGAGAPHAVYRLQPGEALYSSVVVRFTGQIFAEDVNAVAAELAAASGIEDVTDIPIGYEVRIPYDLLLPEFLPAEHPRRREYEASLSTSSAFSNRVQSRHLEGITVILDAGHGGRDVGASMDGVWESLYVYDIMARAKQLLESATAARVIPTVSDGGGFLVADRDVLPFSRAHRVLTDPPYPIEDARVAVNLRWYFANSAFQQTTRAGADPKKVVFVSIHADSLHPTLRGAMVYIPSARLTAGRSGRHDGVYLARREVREQPQVEFSWRQRTESEGLSRQMAEHTVQAFAAAGLVVHPYKPIREKIIRRRSEFVPAVLRYNAVPAKILVEVCNLANEQDRRLIQTRAWRQQMAEAIVRGLLAYYGEGEPAAPGVQVAAGG